MSDSTNNLPQIVTGQTNIPTRLNELFDAASPAILYGRDANTSTGLTWGFIGGRFSGVTVANGTLALAGLSTHYIVAHRTTGVVSSSTLVTNWNDAATYARLYKVVTSNSTITSYEDHRGGSLGSQGDGAATALVAQVQDYINLILTGA